MRIRLIALVVLASGIATPAVAQPVVQAIPERPRIIVDGYGEVKTLPDVATITYTLRGEGPTSDDAVRAMAASGAKVERSLKTIDQGADPRTSEIKISPAKDSACKDKDYDREDDQLSRGTCSIVGYVAIQRVTVRTIAVKDSGTMVGLAARDGAYNVGIDNFDLSDVRPAKRAAIALALADAQTKAAAIASGSHLELGPIVSISTTGSGQNIVVTGSRIPQPDVVSLAPVTVNMNAELITTNATVMVTYAIGK